jgi:hypothetical protein
VAGSGRSHRPIPEPGQRGHHGILAGLVLFQHTHPPKMANTKESKLLIMYNMAILGVFTRAPTRNGGSRNQRPLRPTNAPASHGRIGQCPISAGKYECRSGYRGVMSINLASCPCRAFVAGLGMLAAGGWLRAPIGRRIAGELICSHVHHRCTIAATR